MFSVTDNFEYPVLTKVCGPLNYDNLKVLIDETGANAASVQSDLGGGANGRLGLVITVLEYIYVNVIPYVRHVNPAALNIPTGTSQHESTQLLLEHKEHQNLFREMTLIEKPILNN